MALRVNVGCGNHRAEGWVNVDRTVADDVAPDLVADAASLPLLAGSIERLYAGHLLEHLPFESLRPLVAAWWDLLAPGGRAMVVGPDCDRADRMLAAGEIDDETHVLIERGAGRWAGDEHLWRCCASTMREVLAPWGPSPVPVQQVGSGLGWPLTSEVGWQFAMVLRKEG